MFNKIIFISDYSANVQLRDDVNITASLMNFHVVFEDGKNKIFGQITEIKGNIVTVKFLGEFVEKKFISGTTNKPNLNSKVRPAKHSEIKLITGRDQVGTMKLGKALYYDGNPDLYFDVNNFFSSHFAIFGDSGSGKSCGVSRLFQNMFLDVKLNPTQANIIMFDTSGEYNNAFSNLNEINSNYHYRFISTDEDDPENEHLTIPINLLNEDDLAILLQATSETQLSLIERMRKIALAMGKNEEAATNYKNFLIAKFALTSLYSQDPIANKKNEIISLLNLCPSESFNLNAAVTGAKSAKTFLECFEVDSTGNFKELEFLIKYFSLFLNPAYERYEPSNDSFYNLTTLENALNFVLISEGWLKNRNTSAEAVSLSIKLRTFITSEFSRFFNSDKAVTSRAFLASLISKNDEKCQVVNINLSVMDDSYAKIILKIISRIIFDWSKYENKGSTFPFHIVVDEAHRYINDDNDKQLIGYNIFEKIAKEGPKYGVILGIITQRPVKVSDVVITQCLNFLIFRMNNPIDVEYLREMVPSINDEIVEKQKLLQSGNCYAFGTAFKIPTIVKMELPNPTPWSKKCNIVSFWNNGKVDDDDEAEIDEEDDVVNESAYYEVVSPNDASQNIEKKKAPSSNALELVNLDDTVETNSTNTFILDDEKVDSSSSLSTLLDDKVNDTLGDDLVLGDDKVEDTLGSDMVLGEDKVEDTLGDDLVLGEDKIEDNSNLNIPSLLGDDSDVPLLEENTSMNLSALDDLPEEDTKTNTSVDLVLDEDEDENDSIVEAELPLDEHEEESVESIPENKQESILGSSNSTGANVLVEAKTLIDKPLVKKEANSDKKNEDSSIESIEDLKNALGTDMNFVGDSVVMSTVENGNKALEDIITINSEPSDDSDNKEQEKEEKQEEKKENNQEEKEEEKSEEDKAKEEEKTSDDGILEVPIFSQNINRNKPPKEEASSQFFNPGSIHVPVEVERSMSEDEMVQPLVSFGGPNNQPTNTNNSQPEMFNGAPSGELVNFGNNSQVNAPNNNFNQRQDSPNSMGVVNFGNNSMNDNNNQNNNFNSGMMSQNFNSSMNNNFGSDNNSSNNGFGGFNRIEVPSDLDSNSGSSDDGGNGLSMPLVSFLNGNSTPDNSQMNNNSSPVGNMNINMNNVNSNMSNNMNGNMNFHLNTNYSNDNGNKSNKVSKNDAFSAPTMFTLNGDNNSSNEKHVKSRKVTDTFSEIPTMNLATPMISQGAIDNSFNTPSYNDVPMMIQNVPNEPTGLGSNQFGQLKSDNFSANNMGNKNSFMQNNMNSNNNDNRMNANIAPAGFMPINVSEPSNFGNNNNMSNSGGNKRKVKFNDTFGKPDFSDFNAAMGRPSMNSGTLNFSNNGSMYTNDVQPVNNVGFIPNVPRDMSFGGSNMNDGGDPLSFNAGNSLVSFLDGM